MTDPEIHDATAGACRYLLVALLQRLEPAHPGLLADLRAGVEGDQQALAPGQASPQVAATFAEALRILRLAAGS
jgi:hypothetical protein